MMARRVSGRATTAVDAKMRRCVVRASSRPPPKASEESAVSVGIGRAEMDVKSLLRHEERSQHINRVI